MTTTYAELCQFINDAGMDIITDEDNNNETRISYFLRLLSISLKVYIELQDDGRLVQIYAYPRSHRKAVTSPAAWEYLQERLNEFNMEVRYGRWSIDEEGDARVHVSLFIEDAPLMRRQLARIHFLLSDLMIYQAQVLQIQGCLESHGPSLLFGISGAAVKAVIDHPSEIEAIAEAIHATPPQKRLLYEVIGKVCPATATNDEPSGDASDGSNNGSDTGDASADESGPSAAKGYRSTNTLGRGKRGFALH